MCRLEGKPAPEGSDDPNTWPLHLKETTIANLWAIRDLQVEHNECKLFFEDAARFLTTEPFEGKMTSRTIRACQLSDSEIAQAVTMGKFKEIKINEPLPIGAHGVNVWATPELKRRRRGITEPLLNTVIGKEDLPRLRYPSRMERRLALKRAKYMLQIDMDAFYDSIPLPNSSKRLFVFKSGGRWYHLLTLPTGARWSVAVGQGITWILVDFAHTITIWTMIDNILLAGEAGQEKEFVAAVRELCTRLAAANLQTSPRTRDLMRMTDDEILALASEPNTFLGETFTWNDETQERWINNSTKTCAKLIVSARTTTFTYRSFIAYVALILYAMHTTCINAALFFNMAKAFRGIATHVAKTNCSWDEKLEFISAAAKTEITTLTSHLIENKPARIPEPRKPSYDDDEFTDIIFVDASVSGWGALHRHNGRTWSYQKMWRNTLGRTGNTDAPEATTSGERAVTFYAKHSAHAEPRAVTEVFRHIKNKNRIGSKIAVVTDHFAIVQAQKGLGGFGGMAKGRSLNEMFAVTNEADCTFFYIAGPKNPADHSSRNFGGDGDGIMEARTELFLPRLAETYCPLLDKGEERPPWMR